MKNSVGSHIAMNGRIEFKLQVTATPGFQSLYDWCFQSMWLISGAPDNPEDETAMEMRSTKALYSTVKSLMHVIRTEDHDAQRDAARQMNQIPQPRMICR